LKRVIVGAPGLFAAGFAAAGDAWATVVERSRVFGISGGESSELAWLGLPPGAKELAQGPLAAAAFGVWPPERSVVFQVTLMGIDEDGPIGSVSLSPHESRVFFEKLETLNQRGWTFVRGEGDTHVLVRQRGSVDVACRPPWELFDWEPEWPEGDDSETLRQFVLNSRELFEGAEENRRRRDKGEPIVAFAWMWEPGLWESLPNLALTRGEPVRYESSWLRLKGAARLAGYSHGELGLTFERRLEAAVKATEPMVVVQSITDEEEAERFGRQIKELVFDPLVLKKSAGELRLTILDSESEGLGLNFDSRRVEPNKLPFDRRVLDDERLAAYPLHESILRALSY
jgi:hypothetical protein